MEVGDRMAEIQEEGSVSENKGARVWSAAFCVSFEVEH